MDIYKKVMQIGNIDGVKPADSTETLPGTGNPADGNIQPREEHINKHLQSATDKNAQGREQSKRILKEYSANMEKAGQLRQEIARGTRDGEDLRILFLKAVECISKMTGDSAYNNSVKEHLENRLNPVSPDNQE
jgi:hypothetical protein